MIEFDLNRATETKVLLIGKHAQRECGQAGGQELRRRGESPHEHVGTQQRSLWPLALPSVSFMFYTYANYTQYKAINEGNRICPGIYGYAVPRRTHILCYVR